MRREISHVIKHANNAQITAILLRQDYDSLSDIFSVIEASDDDVQAKWYGVYNDMMRWTTWR